MQSYHTSFTEVSTVGIRISLTGTTGVEIGHVYVFLIMNDLHEEPYALIEDLCVIVNERSKGVGSALLKEASKVAREKKCHKIIANSRFGRDELHDWYVKKGFEKFGYEFRMNLS